MESKSKPNEWSFEWALAEAKKYSLKYHKTCGAAAPPPLIRHGKQVPA